MFFFYKEKLYDDKMIACGQINDRECGKYDCVR